MKRKMELVELGIPLGLICPTSTSEKAMPTKAMPPIKSFLGKFTFFHVLNYLYVLPFILHPFPEPISFFRNLFYI